MILHRSNVDSATESVIAKSSSIQSNVAAQPLSYSLQSPVEHLPEHEVRIKEIKRNPSSCHIWASAEVDCVSNLKTSVLS